VLPLHLALAGTESENGDGRKAYNPTGHAGETADQQAVPEEEPTGIEPVTSCLQSPSDAGG
jgi:hypothetical protein